MGAGVGNGLFLRARRWGIDHQERKNLQIPGGIPGGMVTGQIEPCITAKFLLQNFHFVDSTIHMRSRSTLFICKVIGFGVNVAWTWCPTSVLISSDVDQSYWSVVCERQTYFPSSLLSLRKLREATTGDTSAVRRPSDPWPTVKMPEMRAIPQLVLASLNPIPTPIPIINPRANACHEKEQCFLIKLWAALYLAFIIYCWQPDN